MTDYVGLALTQLKAILADIDPSPQPDPANIWAHPADYASIDLSSLDTAAKIIVARALDQQEKWGQFTAFGGDAHDVTLEILIFLGTFPLTPGDQATVETKAAPWYAALHTVLRAAGDDVNDTLRELGNNEYLFQAQQGGIEWAGSAYWGIRALLPARIEVTY